MALAALGLASASGVGRGVGPRPLRGPQALAGGPVGGGSEAASCDDTQAGSDTVEMLERGNSSTRLPSEANFGNALRLRTFVTTAKNLYWRSTAFNGRICVSNAGHLEISCLSISQDLVSAAATAFASSWKRIPPRIVIRIIGNGINVDDADIPGPGPCQFFGAPWGATSCIALAASADHVPGSGSAALTTLSILASKVASRGRRRRVPVVWKGARLPLVGAPRRDWRRLHVIGRRRLRVIFRRRRMGGLRGDHRQVVLNELFSLHDEALGEQAVQFFLHPAAAKSSGLEAAFDFLF